MVLTKLTREQAKQKIKELVDDYNKRIKGREASLDERNTERFVERILEILNWDIDNFDQVVRRDAVRVEERRKIPDYVLYTNGEKKVVIEVKAFGESLDNAQYIRQALEYGYYKQVRVCILTNGKELRVYDPFLLTKSSEGKLLFSVHINQYEQLFEQRLWFLSQDEIKENTILAKFASKGEVKKPISEEVIDNIIRGRKILIDTIIALNKINDFNLAREYAHKIINRFLFIRVAEDRGFFKEFNHGRILEDRVHIFKKRISQKIKPLMNEIKELFMEINDVYNGELFKSHPCEELKIDSSVLEKLIYMMYFIKHENGEEDQVDFSKLDADVLGSIYEKFLGTIIHETKSGKLVEKVDNGVRKEMGQYYTPQYIVDFIVQNTINVYLEEAPDKLFSIKVVDPACGSGAFLIKAFDSLYNQYLDFNKQQESKRKRTNDLSGYINDKSIARINEVILHKHIHGVDLDSEAVELAKINLWLRTIQEEMKLNELNNNIKQGNSIVSDKSIDKKHAFDWDKEFPHKFDIIIGNPPWISIKGKHKSIDVSEEELNYYFKTYNCDTYRPNMYEIFIRKGLSLISEGGYFSFIVPDRLCYNEQFKELRKEILENFTIKRLWFKPKFPGIIGDTVVFVLQNKKPNNNLIEIAEYPSSEFYKIPQELYSLSSDYTWFYAKKEILEMFNRTKSISVTKLLAELFQTNVGFIARPESLTNYQEKPSQITVIKGENIGRFLKTKNWWFNFEKRNLIGGTQNTDKLGKKYKVLLRKTGIDLIATFDDSGIFPEQSLYFIYTDEDRNKEDLIFLTGLLNSKLMNAYYRNFAITNRDATPQLKKADLDKFPIIIPSNQIKDKVNSIVVELMKLQKSYSAVMSKLINSDATKKGHYDLVEEKTMIKQEIDKREGMLNDSIYELYGLNESEVSIVRESLI